MSATLALPLVPSVLCAKSLPMKHSTCLVSNTYGRQSSKCLVSKTPALSAIARRHPSPPPPHVHGAPK
eukprot:2820525-Prorocentrum_lima.AAC.1